MTERTHFPWLRKSIGPASQFGTNDQALVLARCPEALERDIKLPIKERKNPRPIDV
jgi:hypothetical protein